MREARAEVLESASLKCLYGARDAPRALPPLALNAYALYFPLRKMFSLVRNCRACTWLRVAQCAFACVLVVAELK